MTDQNKIREILRQAGLDIDPSNEDFDRPFSEIGLDSLDVFGFLSEIELVLGKKFSDREFATLRNLNDVIALLEK